MSDFVNVAEFVPFNPEEYGLKPDADRDSVDAPEADDPNKRRRLNQTQKAPRCLGLGLL